jgi:glucose/mannose-6-phosphate isomerase
MTTLLDEPGRWPEVDAERAGELIRDLPEQLKTGEALGRDAAAGVRLRGFENVAVLGMGGSGIVGRVLAAYAQSRLETPVMVIREFDAPAWLGPKTLAVTVSYSGNTLETLTATREAMARAAGVLAVTSGGKLAEMAQAGGHTWIKVPPGQPPRCALGFMAGGVFSFLRGAAGLKLDGLTETIVHLGRCWRRWGFDVPEADNDAKKAAAALAGAAGAPV